MGDAGRRVEGVMDPAENTRSRGVGGETSGPVKSGTRCRDYAICVDMKL